MIAVTFELKDLPERIQRRILVSPDGCWLWTGSLTRGYGQIELEKVNGKRKTWLAHRLVWELLVGEPGPNLHHRLTCPKHCVNPAHLESLSLADHSSLHGERDTCRYGHSFHDAYIRPDGGGRQCRKCNRIRQRKRYRNLSDKDRSAEIAARTERRRQARASG